MSPKEYKELSIKFLVALRQRLFDEGYAFEPEVLGVQGNLMHIALMDEVYTLYNDGNKAWWEFAGYRK